jgi:hypothetical protein
MTDTLASRLHSLCSRFSRTQIVWATLGVSMTCVAGALAVLEDRPLPSPTALTQMDEAPIRSLDAIFERTELDDGRWDGIVIHHSGATTGSPDSLDAQHRELGFRGLGYHFVIGNGFGSTDGEVHVGYRWQQQLPGAHTAGVNSDYYNRRTLGICLVGDGEKRAFSDAQLMALTQLVSELQRELDLPDDHVMLHRDVAPRSGPGRLFPEAAFRARLAEID